MKTKLKLNKHYRIKSSLINAWFKVIEITKKRVTIEWNSGSINHDDDIYLDSDEEPAPDLDKKDTVRDDLEELLR